MAKLLSFVFLLGLLFLGGCQQEPAALASLSAPSLAAPVVAVSAAPAIAIIPTTRPATNPHPAPQTAATPPAPDIPAGWIPPVAANHWQWIIIHHSASSHGNAQIFDHAHRLRGWDELGYHFVIGNGQGSGDGQIEVGPRWPKQKWGAHAKTPDNQFNDYGIGICLVGNFDTDHPTPAQMASLTRLTVHLLRTYHIPPTRILGHGQTKSTDCPGRYLDIAAIRRTLATQLAAITTTLAAVRQ